MIASQALAGPSQPPGWICHRSCRSTCKARKSHDCDRRWICDLTGHQDGGNSRRSRRRDDSTGDLTGQRCGVITAFAGYDQICRGECILEAGRLA